MPADTTNERPFTGQDRSGQTFGRLTIVRLTGFYRSPNNPHRFAVWNCRCKCGNDVDVKIGSLTTGSVVSCGCFHREHLLKIAVKHGHARDGKKHPLYPRWLGMTQRCTNPNNRAYKYYGGRGIKICSGWKSFASFLADLGPSWEKGLTVDRKDVNKHYSCGKCEECHNNGWAANCCWKTAKEQNLNTRRNVWIEHGGKRLTVSGWSELLGISQGTIYGRVAHGKPAAECLFKGKLPRSKQ